MPGTITSSVISTTAPSARAVTYCAIGNAYGGLPSNLMFPMDRSFLHLALLLTAGTPRRSVIGTDTLRISVLLQVSSDDQERE